MFERQYMAVKSEDLQKKVQEFTLSTRFWTAYPADKIEHILKYYHLLPEGFHYAQFDPSAEAAIFVGPPQLTDSGLPDGFQMLPDTGAERKLTGNNTDALRALPKPPDEQ